MLTAFHRFGALRLAAILVGVASFVAFAPVLAYAQTSTRDPLTGIEIGGHLGYGAFSNGGVSSRAWRSSPGDLTGSVGLQLHVGYRIIPALSLGAHLSWNLQGSRLAGPSLDSGGSAFGLGVFARLHVLEFRHPGANRSVKGTPDFFVGVGVDPFASASLWQRAYLFGTIIAGEASVNGYSFPFHIGFEYGIADHVFIGGMASFAPWVQVSGCSSSVGCGFYGNTSDLFYFFGLGARGHFHLGQ